MMCLVALVVSLVALVKAEGPCDILDAAGNPCVAAHSTVRALYAKYTGPIYQVQTATAFTNISVLEAGGYANVSAHDEFCKAGDCEISILYDQSPQGNHLRQRITGYGPPPQTGGVVHQMVNASKHPISVGKGMKVYGMWFDPGDGYHIDFTNGIAKGADPESIFAVMSGKRFNGNCCFDYGNSENTVSADGDYNSGAMEAIYFGNAHWKGNTGYGNGPWVGADLEAGMYFGGGNTTIVNNQSKPLTSDFVSLHLKGRTDGFTLKGGDATTGSFSTMYEGPRPDPKLACCVDKVHHYQPMRKQGAIILGTGGDNSNGAEGNFYEGYMTTGDTTSATDEAVQQNIIAVGYKFTAGSFGA